MSKLRSLVYLVLYLGALIVLRHFVGLAFPSLPADADSMWFASGLLLVILGVFVTEKHFTKSLDVVVSSITLLVVLHTIDPNARFTLYGPVYYYTIIVCAMAILSFALSDDEADPTSLKQRFAGSLYGMSSLLGSARLLFSIVFILSLFHYFIYSLENAALINQQQIIILWMVVFWATALLVEPIDRRFIAPLIRFFSSHSTERAIGRVVRRISPNILIVEKARDLEIPVFGALALVSANGKPVAGSGLVAMYLDEIETEEGRYLQFYVIGGRAGESNQYNLLTTLSEERASDYLQESLVENAVYQRRDNIVGTISVHSDIDVIQIKMLTGVDWRMKLAEGDLLSAELYGKHVKYQVLGVATDAEGVGGQSKKGTKYISAQQVGEWDPTQQKFVNASWVPDYNALVFQEPTNMSAMHALGGNFFRVGLVPKSQYPVYINFDETVSHHLAIIGKTGTGKSQMAAKIVNSLASAGYKIVVLEVDRNHPQSLSRRIDQSLVSAEQTSWTSTQIPRPRSRQGEMQASWSCTMDLAPADGKPVFIVNLDNHAAALDGGPLSHSESASAVVKAVLTYKMKLGNEDQKICIAMEEAYDFIPESTFGNQDFGQPNVSRIAQLVLKCRKHNVGFLVITQRTALVSKTILYQCNTIIALQTFDETSKTFMSAYINNRYLESMSILPRFRAIVVGKGSTCDKPVIVDFQERSGIERGDSDDSA